MDDEPVLGQGYYWQDLAVGQTFRTFRRTITETDLVNFISTTGMLEAIFIDADFEGGAMSGRAVPAMLVSSLIEGLLFQSMIQGTGLALLEMAITPRKPVLVNDTIWARVAVTGVRATSKHGRGIVDCEVTVFNQRDEAVLDYRVKRLSAGRPASAE